MRYALSLKPLLKAIWITNKSHEVTTIIKVTNCGKKASIDEFYLDLTGMDKFFGCYNWTTELASKISHSGLSVLHQ
jgi:DNA polymerase-4